MWNTYTLRSPLILVYILLKNKNPQRCWYPISRRRQALGKTTDAAGFQFDADVPLPLVLHVQLIPSLRFHSTRVFNLHRNQFNGVEEHRPMATGVLIYATMVYPPFRLHLSPLFVIAPESVVYTHTDAPGCQTYQWTTYDTPAAGRCKTYFRPQEVIPQALLMPWTWRPSK
jgi:hypothetical protein